MNGDGIVEIGLGRAHADRYRNALQQLSVARNVTSDYDAHGNRTRITRPDGAWACPESADGVLS